LDLTNALFLITLILIVFEKTSQLDLKIKISEKASNLDLTNALFLIILILIEFEKTS